MTREAASSSADVLIIGSGINSLVCAAELAMRGRKVIVFEREQIAGGCIRTAEATQPGWRHDLFSMSYPLFVTAAHYPLLREPLAAAGLRFLTPKVPTAVVLPDDRALMFCQSRTENIAAFDAISPGDGAAYARAMGEIEANAELIFGLLGQEPRSFATLRLIGKQLRKRGTSGTAAVAGDLLPAMRGWLEHEFRSDLVRALIAPWILHVGLGPESSLSAAMAKLILFTLEAVGNPFVEGGSDRIVTAFRRVIEDHGGRIETGIDIARITTERGVATGIESTDGRHWSARRAVVCNATPTQLYQRLLDPAALPEDVIRRADAYAYGRADMQIHIALDAPPRWSADPALGEVALVHLTPGLDGISRAINEAERGLLPAEATIVVGQPCATDSSRCPPGASMLWIQLQELPRKVGGDAAGLIAATPDGGWTSELAAAYADRILARLRRHITNLDEATVGMTILSPADLEAANINLVGGDPYSGSCSIDQFHLFRPFPGSRNHRTAIKRLWHIGASTHPGPGLGGMSGHLAAQDIG